MPGIDSFFTRYHEFCQFVKMTFEAIRGSWTSRLAAGERLPPLSEALSRWPHGFAADGKTSPLQRVFILAQVCPAQSHTQLPGPERLMADLHFTCVGSTRRRPFGCVPCERRWCISLAANGHTSSSILTHHEGFPDCSSGLPNGR